jgi:hypothetical protein
MEFVPVFEEQKRPGAAVIKVPFDERAIHGGVKSATTLSWARFQVTTWGTSGFFSVLPGQNGQSGDSRLAAASDWVMLSYHAISPHKRGQSPK